MTGKNRSVSRLCIYSRRQIFAIFHRDFDKPKKSPVVAALQLNVGDIATQSVAYFKVQKKPKDEQKRLRVAIRPISGENEAHAEIDGKVTEGLSKHLRKYGQLRWEPRWVRFVYRCLRRLNCAHKLGAHFAP